MATDDLEPQPGEDLSAPDDASGSPAPSEPNLSAAYLPYDDERLWVGMPAEQRGRRHAGKRRSENRAKARASAERSEPTRTSRLSRPSTVGRRRIAAAVLTLALPISAFAAMGALSTDTVLPGPADSASTSPMPTVLDIVGLRAERISSKRVDVAWDALTTDGSITYEVSRDGVVIARTYQTTFADTEVDPQRYYYYSVTAVEAGEIRGSSPQLLVAVPSATGQLPTGSVPEEPTSTLSSSSSTPSKTPSPSPSKVKWPKVDISRPAPVETTVSTTSQPPPPPPPPSP